jgi:hypothetical protein
MVINPFVLFNNILSAAQIRLPLTVAAYYRPTAKQSILALMTVKTWHLRRKPTQNISKEGCLANYRPVRATVTWNEIREVCNKCVTELTGEQSGLVVCSLVVTDSILKPDTHQQVGQSEGHQLNTAIKY